MIDGNATPDSFRASREGGLALVLEEAFTVGVRLRSARQVPTDSNAFRAHVKQLLVSADREARTLGYSDETVRLAVYAYIAFLDEGVLTASQPMFSEWTKRPLQEEVFGDQVAGERFFRHLADLLARQDAEEVADLLEVYQLCLLLGFQGKYSANPSGIQSLVAMVGEKIARIRRRLDAEPPEWALPEGEQAPAGRDPWVARLGIAAVVAVVVTLTIYLVLNVSLGASLGELRALSASLMR